MKYRIKTEYQNHNKLLAIYTTIIKCNVEELMTKVRQVFKYEFTRINPEYYKIQVFDDLTGNCKLDLVFEKTNFDKIKTASVGKKYKKSSKLNKLLNG